MKREGSGPTSFRRREHAFARLLAVGVVLSCARSTLSSPPKPPANPAIAIVVHSGTPADNLTIAEVRKIFLGDRQYWNPGQRVVLLIRAPVARERDVVLRKIYQMSEGQFRQYWIAKIFRDQTPSGPKIVYSSEMTTELVAAIPGSVGFMDANKVGPGVKVLRVGGKLPGESGYPLQ